MRDDVVIVRFVGDNVNGTPAIQVEEVDRDGRTVQYLATFELTAEEGMVPLGPEYEGQIAFDDLPVVTPEPDMTTVDDDLAAALDEDGMPDLPGGS